MTLNTSDELRRLYQSPILSRPNFNSQYRDYNTNKYNFCRDNYRDYSKYDYSRDLSRDSNRFDNFRDYNYNTNKDYFDNNYNKYSNSYDNFKDYNSNRYFRDNFRDYNRDYSYPHFNNYQNRDFNQHLPESSFVMPNYLKSFERFTPNRYSNFQTPSKYNGLTSPNRYNLLNLNNKFNTSLNRDYSYPHFNNYQNRDDWDNYHNISNSPNLKFKTQFYPHNHLSSYNYRDYSKYDYSRDLSRDSNRFDNFRDYNYNTNKDYSRYDFLRDRDLSKDDFNYSYHDPSRDNLFRRNYNDMKDLKDNMKFVYNRDKLEKIKSNLNSAPFNSSLTSSFNFHPLDDTRWSNLHRDRRDLDPRSPVPYRYRSRSTGDLEELDIDEVYRKLKEQKKQLQSLKANLN